MPIQHAPNAALLIDFDNVTLGVRSDLAKELRTLLNSEIIRGKVAVQRAYADWRRYPQYIVSLSESSIDLIFAPAFGTNKKNATDIRLAVDAMELVFTRPEIGSFILLSGDSDFSSLVLKLKEYGKYVIGVGIRESASDVLIQNCDEYYSYSELAGLSKESETTGPPRDPWELVVEAVKQMAEHRDVMRADRLKQVMQQIDPAFDERNAGYNRFSKFITEAGERGLIEVIKQESGQLDVAPAAPRGSSGGRAAPKRETPKRGALAPSSTEAAPAPGRRRRGGRGRGKAAEESAPTRTSPRGIEGLTLAEAFHLLTRALGELPAPVAHEVLRARMAALHGQEDPLLSPERFDKLLRQANDAEIADVRMVAENEYEISPHKADLALQVRPVAETGGAAEGSTPAARPAAALRFRGGSRSSQRLPEIPMVGVIDLDTGTAPVVAVEAPAPELPGLAPEIPAAAPEEAPRKKTRRGKRGGRRHKRAGTATDESSGADNASTASADVAGMPAREQDGKGAKRSTGRTSKPHAA